MKRAIVLAAAASIAACNAQPADQGDAVSPVASAGGGTVVPHGGNMIPHVETPCSPRTGDGKFVVRFTCGQVINVASANATLQAATAVAVSNWSGLLFGANMWTLVSVPGTGVTVPVTFADTTTYNNPYYCGNTNAGPAIVIYRSDNPANCADGFNDSRDLQAVVLHELSHALGLQGHLAQNPATTSPVYGCSNTLRLDKVFNPSVCSHESQRVLYYYGIRPTDVNTTKHMMSGLRVAETVFSVFSGPATVPILKLEFAGKSPTFTPPLASTLPATQLTWTSAAPSIATVTPTGATATVTKGTSTGTTTVSVTYSGAASALAYDRYYPFSDGVVYISNTPPIYAITKMAGGASGPAGTALNPAPKVKVTNSGVAVSGAVVTFAVTAGGGSVSPASVTTNASGEATTAWTLGAAAGTNTLSAATPFAPSLVISATGAVMPTITSFTYAGCDVYVATNGKTYNTFTFNWTMSSTPSGTATYQVGEYGSNTPASAAVVKQGTASTGVTTIGGDFAPLAGPYLKSTSTNNKYWWVRLQDGAITGPWTQLAAPKFPLDAKSCAAPT